MPVSVTDGLQSKEDSVRSEAADVWTHPSLLFWKGVFGLVDVHVTVCIIVICFVAVQSGQFGTVLIEHFALCYAIHAFV